MLVLGIETSCDDTGVALVRDGADVLVNLVSSQLEHGRFGGVVPEIAARRHVEALPLLLDACLAEAGVGPSQVDGVAITRGPGLIGALLVGWCYGRALARGWERPYVGVHHLAAHVHGALMPALAAGVKVEYPLVALVVSGGHTCLYRVPEPGRFILLGQTRDDAAGEAFDKVAKLLGLGYPGGPVIDRLAAAGDPEAYALPCPELGVDFSFSGLKTAVRRLALEQRLPFAAPDDRRVIDLAASFRRAVVESLTKTTERALERERPAGLVLCGGVAANRLLGERFAAVAARLHLPLYRSPPRLATDNGAMIAGAGTARLLRGQCDPWQLGARASSPLGERPAAQGLLD